MLKISLTNQSAENLLFNMAEDAQVESGSDGNQNEAIEKSSYTANSNKKIG